MKKRLFKKVSLMVLLALGGLFLFISGTDIQFNKRPAEFFQEAFAEEFDPSFVPDTPILGEPQEDQPAEYVPGEVLVKIKEGVEPQSILEESGIEAEAMGRILSVKPALAKFKKTQELEKDSQGWYWYFGKQYRDIGDIPDEEFFKEAYEEMIPEKQALYRIYKIDLPQGVSVEEAVARLEENPNVEFAHPNYKAKVFTPPNDPFFSSSGSWGQGYDDLWGFKIDKLDCEAAWSISEGEGVVVAVIDTGIDYNHEDLINNLWINPKEVNDVNSDSKVDINDVDTNGDGQISAAEFSAVSDGYDGFSPAAEPGIDNGYVDDILGYDFAYSDNDPFDFYGHGSHCSGTIAAEGNNLLGVIGVAPKAKIMTAKGLNNSGGGSEIDLVAAIEYAADNGAQVLSNSWGFPTTPSVPSVEAAIDYADALGCVVIFAAGNRNIDVANTSPANYSKTLAVAASTQNDEKCDFSNYGNLIDFSAPGGGYPNELVTGVYDNYNILSTINDSSSLAGLSPELFVAPGYYRLAGTSMACPHVSGVAALLLAKQPSLTNSQVYDLLKDSADDIGAPGKDIYFGHGRVNAIAACALISPDTTPPTTPAVSDEGEVTSSTSQLYASWVSQDPESGVVENQYKITQGSPTGTVIRDWTSAGRYNYVTAGGFSLTLYETYYFSVRTKNYAGLWSAAGSSDGILIVPPGPLGHLVGMVYEKKVGPIAGATVTVGPRSDVTDQNGNYEIRYIPVGKHIGKVSKADYYFYSKKAKVKEDKTKEKDFKLKRVYYSNASGTVYDDDTEQPLAGATLNITVKKRKSKYAIQYENNFYETTVVTDANGNYSVQNIPTGKYLVTLSKPGYVTDTDKLKVKEGETAVEDFYMETP